MPEDHSIKTVTQIKANLTNPKKNYFQKTIRNISRVALMIFFASVLSYLLRIILARELSPTDYGLFYATLSFMMFLLIFRDFGFQSALTKFIAQYQVHQNYSKIKTLIFSSFLFQTLASLILMLLFFLLSSYLSLHYFKSPHAKGILIILGIYVFFSMLCNLASSILQGFQETKWYSATETLRLGSTLLSFLIFFKLGLGIYAPPLAFVTGVLFTFLILSIGLSKYFFLLRFPIKKFKKTSKQLASFAFPVIFSNVGNRVISHLDILILTYFVPLAQVGIYNVILPTALLFLFFGKAISAVLFPLASELWEYQDKKRLTQSVSLIHKYVFLLMTPIIVIAITHSKLLINSLFGSEYATGLLPFKILLVGVLFYLIATNNLIFLTAIGRPALVTKIILISAFINAVLNFILIPQFNLLGAAISTGASYSLVLILSTITIKQFIPLASPWKKWFKTLIAGTIMILSITFLQSHFKFHQFTEFFLFSFIGIITYLFVAIYFNLLNFKEIKQFLSSIREKN